MHGDATGATVLSRGIQHATEDRVGTAALEQIFHSGGAQIMAAAVLISTFGCANGPHDGRARVYYAMSKDGPSSSNPSASCIQVEHAGRRHTRAGAMDRRTLCLGLLRPVARLHHFRRVVLLHSYDCGLFVLRVKRPDAERPYRLSVIPFFRRSISRWLHGSVSYYCGTSRSTHGRSGARPARHSRLFRLDSSQQEGLTVFSFDSLLEEEGPHPCPDCFASNPCRC